MQNDRLDEAQARIKIAGRNNNRGYADDTTHLFYGRKQRRTKKPLDESAAAAASLQSCPTLCDPIDGSQPGFPSLRFSRQEHWSGLPFPSPMHESEK